LGNQAVIGPASRKYVMDEGRDVDMEFIRLPQLDHLGSDQDAVGDSLAGCIIDILFTPFRSEREDQQLEQGIIC